MRRAVVVFAMLASCKSSDNAAPRPAPTTTTTTTTTSTSPSMDAGTDSDTPLGPPRVYVGCGDGKIRLYTFDTASATMTLSDTTNAGGNASFLALTSDHRFLYAVDEANGQLNAFSVESPSGKLTSLGGVASGGAGPTHVSIDRKGNYVMVANYNGGAISVFPRQADGKLGAATATKSFGADAQTHEIRTDPSNAFVLVPNKGHDAVSVFRLEANGNLTDVSLAGYPAGDGARHLDFDGQGKYVYVADENSSMVNVLSLNASTGALSPVQALSALDPSFTGANTGAEIQLTPDGKHVLSSNRGDDSLAVFDVNAADGKLTRTSRVSTGGKTPRHFSIDPTGRFLFVGNLDSGTVVIMKLDATTGVPAPIGSPVSVPSPAYVSLVYL